MGAVEFLSRREVCVVNVKINTKDTMRPTGYTFMNKDYVVHGASKNSPWCGPLGGKGACRMFYNTI